MRILLALLLFTSCVARIRGRFSFSCAREYFQEEKLANFIVVASNGGGRSELLCKLFLKSLDVKCVASNISKAMEMSKNGIVKNVILFPSSPADIGSEYVNVEWANARIFLVLTNVYSSADSIRSIFRKFPNSMQRQVVVMARMSDNTWKFFEYLENRCLSDGKSSFEVVAECKNTGKNIRYLSRDLRRRHKSCPLIVAARQFEPFTYYDDIKGFNDGIDYLIVKAISARLQQEVEFIRVGNGSTDDVRKIE